MNKASKLFFILTVIQFFGFGADTFIIATVLGASSAAEYNVVFRFYTLLIFGFSVFSSTIWPFFSKYHFEKKFLLMNAIAKKGLQLSLLYGGLSLLLLTFLVPIIIDEVLNIKIISDTNIYFMLGTQALLVVNTSIVIPMLNAMEKLKEQVYLGLLSITSNCILTVIFIKLNGISGAPLATIISHLIFGVIPLNYILFRTLKNDINKFETDKKNISQI
jgi:O-antigen/teichoic acid export membrane protein